MASRPTPGPIYKKPYGGLSNTKNPLSASAAGQTDKGVSLDPPEQPMPIFQRPPNTSGGPVSSSAAPSYLGGRTAPTGPSSGRQGAIDRANAIKNAPPRSGPPMIGMPMPRRVEPNQDRSWKPDQGFEGGNGFNEGEMDSQLPDWWKNNRRERPRYGGKPPQQPGTPPGYMDPRSQDPLGLGIKQGDGLNQLTGKPLTGAVGQSGYPDWFEQGVRQYGMNPEQAAAEWTKATGQPAPQQPQMQAYGGGPMETIGGGPQQAPAGLTWNNGQPSIPAPPGMSYTRGPNGAQLTPTPQSDGLMHALGGGQFQRPPMQGQLGGGPQQVPPGMGRGPQMGGGPQQMPPNRGRGPMQQPLQNPGSQGQLPMPNGGQQMGLMANDPATLAQYGQGGPSFPGNLPAPGWLGTRGGIAGQGNGFDPRQVLQSLQGQFGQF